MAAVIFDLDNTLYSEETYVRSGFKAVSNYLAKKHNLEECIIFDEMMNIFNTKGRGKIFDDILNEFKLSNKENVLSLVYVYRYHYPNIQLYDDSLEILKKLSKNFKLGLITDGRAFVQKRKIESLKLEDVFDSIMCTDVLGEKFWKPSHIPFEITLDYLECNGTESFYIGDDPFKDFKAPKELGMKTIQVKIEKEMDYWEKRGYKRFDADFTVNNLNEILDIVCDLND